MDEREGFEMLLLRNARLLLTEPHAASGEYRDILVAGGKIAAIQDRIEIGNLSVEETDLQGAYVSPGLVDAHVHFIGATWDDGFTSKTPEIFISDFLRGGVTTAVGVLGLGYGCEDLRNLNCKVQALRAEGLSAYMYTGNFRFPSPSITGSAPEDIVTLPYVLGVKITITDKFSSHPSPEEMSRLASEAYVAGLQSGKPGLLHIHVAEYGDPYAYLRKVQEISGVPSDRFVPTHCNTNRDLLDGAVAYALAGNPIDFSAILEPARGCLTSIKASKAIAEILGKGVAPELITLSSDGNVGLPIRDENQKCVGLYMERVLSLWDNVRAMIQDGIEPDLAISFASRYPAQRLGLYPAKGTISVGADADLLAFTNDWTLDRVYMKGRLGLSGGNLLVFSRFEPEMKRRVDLECSR